MYFNWLSQLLALFVFFTASQSFALKNGDHYAEGSDSYQADGSPFEDDYRLGLNSKQSKRFRQGRCEDLADMKIQKYDDKSLFTVKSYYKKTGNRCRLVKLKKATFIKKIAVQIPHRRSNPCEEISFQGPIRVNRTTTYNTPFQHSMNTCKKKTAVVSLLGPSGVEKSFNVCKKPRNSCSTQGACYTELGNQGWKQIRWDHHRKYKSGPKKGLYALENGKTVDTCTASFKAEYKKLTQRQQKDYDKTFTRCRHDEFYREVARKTCPYGPGFKGRGCLNPFHTIACDTSFYAEGTVLCLPSLYGAVYRDVDGRYKKHNCLFECADTGGDFNGYGAGIFDFFSGFAKFNNSNIFVRENIASPNSGYKTHRKYCVVSGKTKKNFLTSTDHVRRNNGYRGIHPLDLARRVQIKSK